jgi:energy-converting hydrogenase B subunit D
MSAVIDAGFIVVVIAATGVALVRDPLRQTLALGVLGLAMTALFFALEAPDVALSELVVGGLGLPLIVLAALRKLGEQERERGAADPAGEGGERA